jgi:hypothetical protein
MIFCYCCSHHTFIYFNLSVFREWFFFVTVDPKYFNFVTFSKDLLTIFTLWSCQWLRLAPFNRPNCIQSFPPLTLHDGSGYSFRNVVYFLIYVRRTWTGTAQSGYWCSDGLLVGRLRFDSRQGQRFSLLQDVQTGWGPPNFLSTGYWGLSPGVKRQADHSPPSSAGVKNGGAIPPLSETSSWRSA